MIQEQYITYFLTPFCLPMWKLGMTHSTPVCVHFSHTGAPGSLLHLILLFRQLRHAACLLAICWRVWEGVSLQSNLLAGLL